MSRPLKAYRTVSQESEIEIVIQRSRFIGRCFPVSQEQAALEKLGELKKRYWDATHNCYAYSICAGGTGGAGAGGETARYSDDGEPGGTAGLPIMECLRKQGVTDVLCVVTRYFGGVLLGAGGLVRAYSRSASEAVRAARPVWMRPCVVYEVDMEYPLWGGMEPLLRAHGEVLDVRYTDRVCANVLVPLEAENAFLRAAIQRSDGRVSPKKLEERHGAFPAEE